MQGETLQPEPTALERLRADYPFVLQNALLLSESGCRCGTCGVELEVSKVVSTICPNTEECSAIWERMIIDEFPSQYPPIAGYIDMDRAAMLLYNIEPQTRRSAPSWFVMRYQGVSRTVENVRVTNDRL